MLGYLLFGAALPLATGAATARSGTGHNPWRLLLAGLVLAIGLGVLAGGFHPFPADVKQFLPHLALLGALLALLPRAGTLAAGLAAAAFVPLFSRPFWQYNWEGAWRFLAPLLLMAALLLFAWLLQRLPKKTTGRLLPEALALLLPVLLSIPAIVAAGSLRMGQFNGALAALLGGSLLLAFLRKQELNLADWHFLMALLYLPLLLLAWLYVPLPGWAALAFACAPLAPLAAPWPRLALATLISLAGLLPVLYVELFSGPSLPY